MKEWRSGGLWVESAVCAGVLRLDVVGLLTPAVANEFCSFGANYPQGVHCLLARFDRAMVAMTPEALTDAIAGAGEAVRLMPGAIICRPSDLALFQIHARRCVDKGIVRAVFTSPFDAERWALRRASAARLAALSRLGLRSPFRAAA